MKKRKKISPAYIVGGVMILCVAAVIVAIGYMAVKGHGITVGQLYIGEAGTFLIEDDDSAMRISDQSVGKNVFDGLTNGDKVLVVHGSVEECYPARAGAYHIFKLAEGDEKYQPADEVLGIAPIDSIGNNTLQTDMVTYTKGDGNISVELPKTWGYAIVDNDDMPWEYYGETIDETAFYIDIWPKEHPEGKLSLRYLGDQFAVCGTGLEQKKIKIGEYKVSQGTYDNAKYWSYIKILDVMGDYVIINKAEEAWWNQYETEVMQILGTLKVALMECRCGFFVTQISCHNYSATYDTFFSPTPQVLN